VVAPPPIPAILIRLIGVIFLVFSAICRGELRWSLGRGVSRILVISDHLDTVAMHIDEEGDEVWEQVFFPAAEGHTDRSIWVHQGRHVDANGAPHLTGREEKAVRMAKRRGHTQKLDPDFLE
jgi:hypothetical protein